MMQPRAAISGLHLRALLWLALAIGVALICTLQFRGHSPLQTNLLALLPATERNPLAEDAVNRLANAAGNRAIFLVGHANEESAFKAARQFADHLTQSDAFKQVIADVGAFNPAQFTDLYVQHRFQLLSDADRQLLQAGNISLSQRLQERLYAPFRFGPSLSIAEDPFGFTDNWIATLPVNSLKLAPENGMLTNHAQGKTWIFITAELPASAYDSATQQRAVHAVNLAEEQLQKAFPTLKLLRAGTVFHANAARENAESEVDRIGAVSLIGMLALLYLVFRSIRPLALGLLSVSFGIGAAIAATIAVYGHIHLITLVFGASLIGEAIDYAIQYFAAHLGAGAQWEPMRGLRRIAPGLTMALLTSLLGYGALSLAPFPALAQIALFALVGLSAAWLSVFLLLPALLKRASKRDPETALALPQRLLRQWQNALSRRRCLVLATVLLVAAVPGWWQLNSNDDIHLLIAKSPSLMAQEEQLRDIIGFGNSSQFFLITGRSAEEVLLHEEALASRLSPLITDGVITGWQGVSAFVPSRARQAANQAVLKQQIFSDTERLQLLLDEAGLKPEVFEGQMAAFNTSVSKADWLTPDSWLQSPIAKPYRHLWLGNTAQGYASLLVPQGIHDIARLKAATADLPSVVLVDKVASVSALFSQYRQSSVSWLLIAIVLVFGVLSVRYRWRQALVIVAPTVLAMILTLAVFGYLHIALTLFNMMGLMLVLGVGVNYAIFLREGGINTASTLAGVLLSAGTTLLSFGMLAFSSMPALSSFGLALLLGISISALLAPMLLSFAQRPTT